MSKKNKRAFDWTKTRTFRYSYGQLKTQERVASEQYGMISGQGTQCQTLKANGKRCESAALEGGTYCRMHSEKRPTP